jgi:nucleotide-binding universal stress UspA family protein
MGNKVIDKLRILVGIDGSDHSKKALMEAITIAKKFSGSIKVISVYKRGMDNKVKEIMEEAKQLLEKEKVEYSTSSILGANPSRALQDVASREKFDLIVVGSRGLGSTASILLGSVSRRVIATAHCNILVVKK